VGRSNKKKGNSPAALAGRQQGHHVISLQFQQLLQVDAPVDFL
jgi:hypothetical protein